MSDILCDEYVMTSSLPENFVLSMRKLFDILDFDNVGLVPLSEIELYWRDDAVPNLPGVLDALRTIAPADGMLNFETFVWGLKIALAKTRKNDQTKPNVSCKTKEKICNVGEKTQRSNPFEPAHRILCLLHETPRAGKDMSSIHHLVILMNLIT